MRKSSRSNPTRSFLARTAMYKNVAGVRYLFEASVASVSESGLSESSALDSSEPQAASINTVDASAESSPSPSPSPSPQASVNVVGGADSTDNSTYHHPPHRPVLVFEHEDCKSMPKWVRQPICWIVIVHHRQTPILLRPTTRALQATFADPTLNSCIITVQQSCPCAPDVCASLNIQDGFGTWFLYLW